MVLIALPLVCALVVLVCIGVNIQSARAAQRAGDRLLFARATKFMKIGLALLVLMLVWAGALIAWWSAR